MNNHPGCHRIPDIVRGPGQPHSHLLTPQLFRFYCPGDSPQKDCPGDASLNHQPLPCRPQRGQDHDWHRRDQRLIPPQPPSPSPDCGFKSNRSSVLTASSVSSQSDRLEGSWYSQCGRPCRETRAHMKINLPIFKDKDAKDAVTYQSWRWDLTIYHHAGCRDHTLLPYTIQSLQGYPRELVPSLGMDITLDDVLTILDKHYNNVKALDALNQDFSNCKWQTKRLYCIGVFAYRDASKFWLLHFQNTSFLTAWPSWNATTFMGGYPNVLKPWWPNLRPAHRKRFIPITCGLQGKQRRKTPWSFPKAHEAKQLITLPNPGWLVSSPYRSSRGPSQHLKHLLYAWHTWKRRVLRRTKKWKVKTLTVLTGSQRNSWCTLQGLWWMPKWKRSTVIIVAVWSTSSTTVH